MIASISRFFFQPIFGGFLSFCSIVRPHTDAHHVHQHHLVHPDEREKGEFEVTFKAYRRHN